MSRKHRHNAAAARRIGNVIAAHEVRLVELERRLENMFRPGAVSDVDPAKQVARLVIGKDADGTPQLGPWVPYAQHAGALKIHASPVKGQQMMHVSPNGDVEQGFILPYTWSEANPSPGTTADHVLTYLSKINITMSDGKLVITIPDTTIKVDDDHALQVSSDGIKTTGKVTNKPSKDAPEKPLDASHTHSGVTPGGATTGQVA